MRDRQGVACAVVGRAGRPRTRTSRPFQAHHHIPSPSALSGPPALSATRCVPMGSVIVRPTTGRVRTMPRTVLGSMVVTGLPPASAVSLSTCTEHGAGECARDSRPASLRRPAPRLIRTFTHWSAGTHTIGRKVPRFSPSGAHLWPGRCAPPKSSTSSTITTPSFRFGPHLPHQSLGTLFYVKKLFSKRGMSGMPHVENAHEHGRFCGAHLGHTANVRYAPCGCT
jgi:hypothetical protein